MDATSIYNFKNIFVWELNWIYLGEFFLQDGVLILLAGKNSRGNPLKFLVKKVVRGNAVQFFSNFPAKSLSIWREHFSSHLFNNLIEFT